MEKKFEKWISDNFQMLGCMEDHEVIFDFSDMRDAFMAGLKAAKENTPEA